MNNKLFGTDGIRGVANKDLTPALALQVGYAAASVLSEKLGRPAKFLLATDTRISKDMLSAATSAGIMSASSSVVNLGGLSTPAVAYLVCELHADAGIVISASHNPFEYNGIKIFNSEGYKLSDELEEAIEERIMDPSKKALAFYQETGSYESADLSELYVDHLVSCASIKSPEQYHIAVDCSNGASSVTAERLFARLGIKADIIHAQPDGKNINTFCGSTDLRSLSAYVRRNNLDLGIAFDGDADRMLAVDENGNEVDGDHVIAICAKRMLEKGILKGNTVVGTIMSNLGLRRFCEDYGLSFFAAKVGDRYVLEEMNASGYNIGGEQSGHIIFSDYATTGDGQLAAIMLLGALSESGKKLSELASCMTHYPQVTLNVHATPVQKSLITESPAILAAADEIRAILGKEGRVLLRASGTEPLIRVMIEGKDEESIERMAKDLVSVIESEKQRN